MLGLVVSHARLVKRCAMIQVTSILFATRRGPDSVPAASRALANGGARFLYREPKAVKFHP